MGMFHCFNVFSALLVFLNPIACSTIYDQTSFKIGSHTLTAIYYEQNCYVDNHQKFDAEYFMTNFKIDHECEIDEYQEKDVVLKLSDEIPNYLKTLESPTNQVFEIKFTVEELFYEFSRKVKELSSESENTQYEYIATFGSVDIYALKSSQGAQEYLEQLAIGFLNDVKVNARYYKLNNLNFHFQNEGHVYDFAYQISKFLNENRPQLKSVLFRVNPDNLKYFREQFHLVQFIQRSCLKIGNTEVSISLEKSLKDLNFNNGDITCNFSENQSLVTESWKDQKVLKYVNVNAGDPNKHSFDSKQVIGAILLSAYNVSQDAELKDFAESTLAISMKTPNDTTDGYYKLASIDPERFLNILNYLSNLETIPLPNRIIFVVNRTDLAKELCKVLNRKSK